MKDIKSFVEYDLGECGRAYIKNVLNTYAHKDYWHPMVDAIGNSELLRVGRIFAFLPPNLTWDRVTMFDSGIIHTVLDEWLEKYLESYFDNDSGCCLFASGEMRNPNWEPKIGDDRPMYYCMDRFTYLVTKANREKLGFAIRDSSIVYPPELGAVSYFPSGTPMPAPFGDLPIELINKIIDEAHAFIIGAYDNEGYILCQKI